MIFSDKKYIEEYVIEALDENPLSGPLLLKAVHASGEVCTKQALYRALRILLAQEVVAKIGKKYTLNRTWLQKVSAFSGRHIAHDTTGILGFEDGDSITYRFNSPHLLDISWGHLYDIVYEAHDKHHAILNYHPHEWLILSRAETEIYFLERFTQDEKILLFTIGSKAPLDRMFRENWQSEFVQIHLGKNYGFKPNQYLSVVGDYIFEITTDDSFEKEVDAIFQQYEILNATAQKAIAILSQKKYKSKIKLSKNKVKADKWRAKFKKDYILSRPYYF